MNECITPEHTVTDKDGYPRVKWRKRLWRLNRLMWSWVNGEIPPGMVVAHSCNNKGCINTNHLYLATPKQNSTDAARDGLYRTGAQHPKHKFDEEIIEEIVRLYDIEHLSQQAIGDILGVSQSRVSDFILKHRKDNR